MHCDSILYLIGAEAESLAVAIFPDNSRPFEIRRFQSFAEFLHDADLDRPGCIVLATGEDSALDDRLAQLIPPSSPLSVIYLTGSTRARNVVNAMLRGAADVLELPVDLGRAAGAVRDAMSVSQGLLEQANYHKASAARIAELTAGEREVLDLMATGVPNKKVAPALGIALRTVEARRKRIFSKLGTRSLLKIAQLMQCVEGCATHSKAATSGVSLVPTENIAVSDTADSIRRE